ncbi:hypothetical protein JNW90_29330 [Micromonospora sp. STR1s_5]|nr:hypothetical protein [Micromonospora sp. STR1s_5]
MKTNITQRWRYGRHSWRRKSEGGFDSDRYTVEPIDQRPALEFVVAHHYSHSWCNDQLRYGLFEHREVWEDGASAPRDVAHLVGVIVLGVPIRREVLTNPLPGLVPYVESRELSKLVLLDEVPANAETWAVTQAFNHAAEEHHLRGVVAFSDPNPQLLHHPDGTTTVAMPGHLGIVYQALNAAYCKTTKADRFIHLPDGTMMHPRALAKIRNGEQGRWGVVARLVDLGAQPPDGEPDTAWLTAELARLGATTEQHEGKHRYVFRVGPDRDRVTIGMPTAPYPKRVIPQPAQLVLA